MAAASGYNHLLKKSHYTFADITDHILRFHYVKSFSLGLSAIYVHYCTVITCVYGRSSVCPKSHSVIGHDVSCSEGYRLPQTSLYCRGCSENNLN